MAEGDEQIGRRELLRRGGWILTAPLLGTWYEPEEMEKWGQGMVIGGGAITDVQGIQVGQVTDSRRPTGCTVVLCGEGAVAGVEVRGAAPGTRETDLLHPLHLVEKVQAVVLTGGSAFGLDVASGVTRYLEEKGRGFETRVARVPIVPAAVLFDLEVGDPRIRPGAEAGYRACQVATQRPPATGNVGAGAGATVGKLLGSARAMKGGLGTASRRLPGGGTVGAIVAVNAVGDVIDPSSGRILAGVRSQDGRRMVGAMRALADGEPIPPLLGGQSTTIGVIATDAPLDKVGATWVARMAHDGLARAIHPVHTQYDGDTLFAVATGQSVGGTTNVTLIGALAAEVVAEAIVGAIRAARGVSGYPAAADLS
jgi:L-aminopeptidase/D-esterase-like protein